MQRNWLYYLLDEQGRSYTSGEVVGKQSTPNPLAETPDGWQDILIGWERNMQKVGLVRSFTFPLGFVQGGARILRHLLYKNSIEERVYLLIQHLTLELTDAAYRFVYKYFYKGEIDLSTLKDDEDKVSVSIAETGLPKLLKAGEATTFEVPVADHAEAIVVKMDGVYLREKHNWLLTAYEFPLGQEGYLVGIYFTTKEGQAAGFASLSQFSEQADPTGAYNFAESQNYFATVTQNIEAVRFTGTLNVGMGAGRARLVILNQDKVEKAVLLDTTVAGNFTVDATFDAVAGERYFLWYDAISVTKFVLQESELSCSFKSRYRTTYIKALKPLTLLGELTKKVTGDATACRSDLLEERAHIALTSIDAVRGIPKAKIKTSLNTFSDCCRVVHAAGIGVEDGKIRIEPFAHFLSTTSPYPLGQAKELKTSVAADLLANTIKVGYNNPSIDDVNGKYAFNASLLFTSPVTRVSKEHALISPYHADPYFIEIKRINFDGKTTTDNSSDNDVVLLNVEPYSNEFTLSGTANHSLFTNDSFTFTDMDRLEDFGTGMRFTLSGTASNDGTYTVTGVIDNTTSFLVFVSETLADESFSGTITTNLYKLKRDTYDAIEGVPEGVESSLFNIDYLTPKRILTRHLPWINSIMWGLQGQKLTYQTTEKNAGLKTVIGGETVDEDADVVIGTERLFLPFYHEFDTEVRTDLPDIMDTDPNASFSTVDENCGELKGIAIKIGIAPNTNKEQAFKLLSSPDNNPQNFIH